MSNVVPAMLSRLRELMKCIPAFVWSTKECDDISTQVGENIDLSKTTGKGLQSLAALE